MHFLPTPITGAWLVQPEARADARGAFARLWSRDELVAHGLCADFVQCNASSNVRKGTLRGLHYQAAPHGEIKLITCIRGRVFDVLVDMRPASPTYRQWFGAELTPDSRQLLYVPEECAHGYLSLEDGSEVIYAVTMAYHPESERGVRWDDPAIGIEWPLVPAVISDKDKQWAHL